MSITSLSDKQIRSFQDSNARINIFEGPVRAGKSFIGLLRWIEFCRTGAKGPLVICGRTDKTIKRNIINPLQDLIGPAVKYSIGKGEVRMFDRIMYVIGANDDRAEAKIRGSEFAGALIDELTLLPENFCKMLLSRLSIPDAKLFASTNPDSPFHWVKTDLIDRQNELNCKVFSYTIDDNPSLSQEYKDELKREYQGLWYKRYIEGLWVMAEGAVYDFFDEDIHVIDYPRSQAQTYIVGIDYGTTNPCVFVLIGYNPSEYPNMWLEKEYYYNSRSTMRQKSDYEYAQDLIEFVDGIHVDAIYVDPSAASFKQELRRNGVQNIRDAVNDVVPGIRFQGQLLTNGTYKICSNCKETIKEYTNYVWDSKASQRGEDKPIKQHDHCFTADTNVSTEHGILPINKVTIGMKVQTRAGFKKVLEIFERESEVFEYTLLGRSIKCTPNHKFMTTDGWKEISLLLESDILLTDIGQLPWHKSLNLMESNTDVIQTLKTLVTDPILGPIKQTALKDTDISIEMFRSTTLEKFHPNTIFITKTTIASTIVLAISSVLQLASTFAFIEKIVQIANCKIEKTQLKKCKNLLKCGTEVKKVEIGTENMQKTCGSQLKESSNVNCAKQNILPEKDQPVNFVAINVSLNGEEIITLITSQKTVKDAVKNFHASNIEKKGFFVQNPVQSYYIGKQKVYNIHVDEHHEYLANNFLVKNCKDAERYALYTHFFNKGGKRMSEEEAELMERAWVIRN